jgi:poly(3-hydroxybutyrate) depolymerase
MFVLRKLINWRIIGILLVSLDNFRKVIGQSTCNYGSDAFSSLFQRNVPHTCFVMKEDGRNRCYYRYVPDCAQGPSPVVFDPHGLGACPTRLGYLNDWMSKADQECIIIVYPVVRLT